MFVINIGIFKFWPNYHCNPLSEDLLIISSLYEIFFIFLGFYWITIINSINFSSPKLQSNSDALNDAAVSVEKKRVFIPAAKITILFFQMSNCPLLIYDSAICYWIDWTFCRYINFSKLLCKDKAFIIAKHIPM